MFYDRDLHKWMLQIYGTTDIYATVNATDYPFGTMDWEVHNDFKCRNGENGTDLVALNINSCKSDEFNCGDGSCVPINQRCDGDINCPDKTGGDGNQRA